MDCGRDDPAPFRRGRHDADLDAPGPRRRLDPEPRGRAEDVRPAGDRGQGALLDREHHRPVQGRLQLLRQAPGEDHLLLRRAHEVSRAAPQRGHRTRHRRAGRTRPATHHTAYELLRDYAPHLSKRARRVGEARLQIALPALPDGAQPLPPRSRQRGMERAEIGTLETTGSFKAPTFFSLLFTELPRAVVPGNPY